jgi:hypothetical protein
MRNEDAYVYEPPLLAIADGMGGARAGEVAAGIAAAALKEKRRTVTNEESLEAAIDEANSRVWQRSVADPGTSGMGTTVMLSSPPFAFAAATRASPAATGSRCAARMVDAISSGLSMSVRPSEQRR